MAMRLFSVVLLVLALPAQAQLYKWVDKNGIVNYTDAPPPDAKVNPTEKLADRVSSYQTDPVTKAAAAARGPSYYELQLEREWSQRQASMARAQLAEAADPRYLDPRYDGYATPYYGPVLISARPVRPLRHLRPARPLIR